MNSINTSAPRFAANIRFVTRYEWRDLGMNSLDGGYEVGICPSWNADDADQFVLKDKPYTDTVGPCVAGGLSGRMKDYVAWLPRHAGLFHLMPIVNLHPQSQATIERKVAFNDVSLQKPLAGLIVGGQFGKPYSQASGELASHMVQLFQRILGRAPSEFTGQNNSTWTAVAYDGRKDTWYVQAYDSRSHRDTDSLDAVKQNFGRRFVDPLDTVYIGLHSETPIPKAELDSPA